MYEFADLFDQSGKFEAVPKHVNEVVLVLVCGLEKLRKLNGRWSRRPS